MQPATVKEHRQLPADAVSRVADRRERERHSVRPRQVEVEPFPPYRGICRLGLSGRRRFPRQLVEVPQVGVRVFPVFTLGQVHH
jgi:hypothetical protein